MPLVSMNATLYEKNLNSEYIYSEEIVIEK